MRNSLFVFQSVHNNRFSLYVANQHFTQFYNMDNVDNEINHTVLPHGNISEHFENCNTIDADAEDNNRHCVSLPVYYDQVNNFFYIYFSFTFLPISFIYLEFHKKRLNNGLKYFIGLRIESDSK